MRTSGRDDMPDEDPFNSDDVGSLAWGRRTGGNLTSTERRDLRRAVLRDARVYAHAIASIDRELVRRVRQVHPHDGFARALASSWRAESRAVPLGRAALAERTVLFSLAARLAP